MTRYYLNKNFIPKSFVESKRKKEEISNKKALLLMCILIITLMPNTIKNIYTNFWSGKEEYTQDREISKNNNKNYESFYWWMDIIKDDTVGTFDNTKATIYVESMSKFYEMVNNTNIRIESMEQCDDKRIKVQISKYTEE